MKDSHSHSNKSLLALSIGALGVVYGDIGTSPLYALRESFQHNKFLELTPDNILGICSLIFWTIVLVINLKYMWFILRADNKGEGGILSLMALATAYGREDSKRRILLLIVGLFGSALLYGDGVITPAISVLSAVEGIKIVTPVFEPYILPITMTLLAGLFFIQRIGTGSIGKVFGPVVLLWFSSIAALGAAGIVENPEILRSLSPHYAVNFFLNNGLHSMLVLGSVFLVVTGGEALYADMGHFGKRPIRAAWVAIVFPCLVLNYMGQGALLLRNPAGIENPFYFLVPESLRIPMVILATLTTIIASQALITGIFSLTRQAVQLGFAPRLRIIHTSSREIGQIYIPTVNWILMAGVMWVVFSFKTSSSLASAYGIAVTATMVVTTFLAFVVARKLWNWPLSRALALFGFFLMIDLAFFGSNLIKIADGGWVPLVIAAFVYLLMSTWKKGRRILAEHLKARSVSVEDFLVRIKQAPPVRVPGTAVYMSGDAWGVPVPLLHNLKHNKVLHERVVLLTIRTVEVPSVNKKERVRIDSMGPNFYRIIANYGFMETPKIKHILEACREQGIHISLQDTTFVLGRETILPTGDPNMAVWREKIFALMARNAERPTAYFKIPPNQVIEVGIQVEI
ncbi:MAG: potassium transporter Kup [Bdellovibrionaceae bacterium]|nr:potassium transporter Kup [Pseudobdellovibrionaceae bacterium]